MNYKAERPFPAIRLGRLCSLLLALGAVLPAAGQGQQWWSATYPLRADGSLMLENAHGGIFIEGWDRSVVEVVAVKTATGLPRDLNQVQVAALSGPNRLELRTIYRGVTSGPVRVEYRLRVPRQVRLEMVSTVEGDIFLKGMEAPAQAQTLSGDIVAEGMAAAVVLESSRGNLAAEFRTLPAFDETARLETLSGNIALILPARAQADLVLDTVAGEMETPYVIRSSGGPGEHPIHVRAGRGGVRFELRTVRGDIRVQEKPRLF